MEFCFVHNFVYINIINKIYHEKNKQEWSCITGDNLRTDCRQHLPRWLFLPCTSKSPGTNRKQELLEQEKGHSIQERTTEFVTVVIPEEVKTWMLKRLGLFYFPSGGTCV
jgi:hypothetical protein